MPAQEVQNCLRFGHRKPQRQRRAVLEGATAFLRTAGGRRIEAAGSSARAGDRVLVLLRSESAALAEAAGPADDGLAGWGVVEDVADPGPVERGRVRLDGGERVTVIRPRRATGPALRCGTRVRLAWPSGEVRLLASES